MEYLKKVHEEIDMMQSSVYVEHHKTKPLIMHFYHSHSDYELLYIRRGQLSVTSNTETVSLKAPALVVHHPYMLHRAATDGREAYERYIIYFNKELVGRLCTLLPEFRKVFFGCMSYLTPDPDLVRRLDDYCAGLEHNFGEKRFRRCEILLTLLFEDLLSSVDPEQIHTVLERHSYVSEVLIAITDSCEQDLTVEGLAKRFFVSRAKLAADFKDYTGMTVKQYILLTRINHAKQLLNVEGVTLSQVAERCGFCDDSHFINTFRRFEGITPKEYLAFGRRGSDSETNS